MVEFCSKCDAILIGKKGQETKCAVCGHIQKAKSSVSLNEKIKSKEEKEIISSDDSAAEIHPLTDAECPECHHTKAYYWTKQTRAGDEPETMFFKCEVCKHQWREYR